MYRVCLPALLVMASCQFGSAEQEVEILPEESVSMATVDQAGTAPASFDGHSGQGSLPQAQIGDWLGPDGELEIEALNFHLSSEHQRTEAALHKAALAEEAQRKAERDLLKLQAAFVQERGQRVELEQERNFLLDRIGEFEARLEEFFADQLLRRQLEEQIAQLQVELYENKIYNPPLGDLSLEDALRATRLAMAEMAEQQKDLEWFDTPEGAGVRLSAQLIFGSGQVELDPEGEKLLRELAQQFIGLLEAGATLQVIGHTDDQPLQAQLHRFPLGNLQLSSQRALVVANFLREAGIPAESMSIAGYGSWQPLASNQTAEGRALNRRVELTLKVPEGLSSEPGPTEAKNLVEPQ
jgi:chemotaxis protein MotB